MKEDVNIADSVLGTIRRAIEIAREQDFEVQAIVFRSGIDRGDVILGLHRDREAEIELNGALYKRVLEELSTFAEIKHGLEALFGIPVRHEP